ncbi:MAG: 4'-phosphopantetheinyl transferase superfamily protein [Prolixibacteraceae bacterium]
MAVKFIEHLEEGLIGFWEISESTENLIALLDPKHKELEHFLKLKNELRKKEWLAVRLLLQKMTGVNSKISYDTEGKPFLVNFPGHISISHSSNCAVIYFHPKEHPGIDIELITRDVAKASRRFLSEQELSDCMINDQPSNKEMMLRWCAKEAVYKIVPFSNIDFASQILCIASPFNSDEGNLVANFISGTSNYNISLKYRLIGEILMVWGHLKI